MNRRCDAGIFSGVRQGLGGWLRTVRSDVNDPTGERANVAILGKVGAVSGEERRVKVLSVQVHDRVRVVQN